MSSISQNSNGFKERKGEACPLCNHRARCKYSIEHGDDLVLCFRVADEAVNGYRRIKQTRECSTYVRVGTAADRKGKKATPGSSPKTPPKPGLKQLAARYAVALTEVHATRFAQELGISVASLRRLCAGMRGSRLCFPERDAAGQIIGISTRYPNQKPKYLVGEGHQRGLLIPAGLPENPACLLLPEGPSDTLAFIEMSLAAVGRPNNNGKAELIAEFVKNVAIPIILGENDQKEDGKWPGKDGAMAVATDLANLLDRPVLWALPPPGFKDVRDYRVAHPDRDPAELGREFLAHVLATATVIHPSVGLVGSLPGGQPESWPDPQPLPNELPPVAPFDLDLLPEAFRDWIHDIAERAQCPRDYPAVGAMVTLASLVGRKVAIRPKRKDNWTVVPNLWGGVIGRPGLLKTPMLQEATRPLKRLEIEAKKRFQDELNQNEARKLVRKAERKELEKAIEKAVKAGEDAEALAISGLADHDDTAPIRTRYIVNDTTVEKLGETLNESPNGVLMYRDELVGFLRSMDKDGHECDRAFYLEAWDGKGRFTYDRIGRGTIDIESAIVSILGGIQPSVLHTFLRSSLDRVGNDGLIQRFQLLVWPDVSKDWVNVDEWPDTKAKNQAYAVFTRMAELDPAAIGAHEPDSDDDFPYLRFDFEAQEAFDEWRGRLEVRLRSGDLHPILEEHLSKYRSLIPSLALLIHLADGGVGSIGIGPLTKAIRWGEYLETHAQRVYYVASNPDIAAAAAIARKLLSGEIKDGFVLRDVYRREWAGLSDRDVVEGGVTLLCDLEWLRRSRVETPGAPKTQYWINPKIQALPEKAPAKTDKSPQDDPLSVLSGGSGEGTENSEPDDSDLRERDAIQSIERDEENGLTT